MTTEQRVSRWIKTHGYGLNYKGLKGLISKHKNGTDVDREFVEKLLTEINYHTECSLLKRGHHDFLRKYVDEQLKVIETNARRIIG